MDSLGLHHQKLRGFSKMIHSAGGVVTDSLRGELVFRMVLLHEMK